MFYISFETLGFPCCMREYIFALLNLNL